MPKVSICIPTYNQTSYLRRTLESALIQSFQDFEIIITDDSRSSIVKELVHQFQYDKRIKYYHNTTSLGSPKNWNFCIEKAQGEYIKIMHHDDWFSNEDSLLMFVEALDKSGGSMAFSNADVVFAKSNKRGTHLPSNENILNLKTNPSILFLGNFIGAPSMIMYRKDLLLDFDENLKWLVDVDFYIRLLQQQPQFIYINEKLITIVTDASHTVTTMCYGNRDIEIFENFYLYNKIRQKIPSGQILNFSLFLLNLVSRFNISSLDEIRIAGYKNDLAWHFKLLYKLKRLKTKTSRILNRK